MRAVCWAFGCLECCKERSKQQPAVNVSLMSNSRRYPATDTSPVPKRASVPVQVSSLGALSWVGRLAQQESAAPCIGKKTGATRLASLTCLACARMQAQRARSEQRWGSAASSGSPCGLDVLHGGNVVWTTVGALLGSINAGKYVGVGVLVYS